MSASISVAKAADPFFETIFDGQWNACVGIQGDEQNYVDGYIEAALELISAVIDKKMIMSRDTLAMPILYNGRHALELSLKFAINHLHRMGAVGARHRSNHDILSHWTHLRDARVGDASIRTLVSELEPFVVSLAKIDNDGQELRYAENSHGQKSLGGIAIVNLSHIRTSLESMSRILERLKDRVFDLEAERSTGSYTPECSRGDLKEIAAMIGERTSWKDKGFDEKKAAVCARFDLSNRKFSNAVNKILQSRELATLVGIETELTYLKDEKAVFALEQWLKANPERTIEPADAGIDYFHRDRDKFEEYNRLAGELRETIIDGLSIEELSDLETLFYIGRGTEFGEHYDRMLTKTLGTHRLAKSRWEGVDHIMSKTNLLDNVVKGCKVAGRPTLAAKLRALRPGVKADNSRINEKHTM